MAQKAVRPGCCGAEHRPAGWTPCELGPNTVPTHSNTAVITVHRAPAVSRFRAPRVPTHPSLVSDPLHATTQMTKADSWSCGGCRAGYPTPLVPKTTMFASPYAHVLTGRGGRLAETRPTATTPGQDQAERNLGGKSRDHSQDGARPGPASTGLAGPLPVGWSRWNGHQELLVRGPGPIEHRYVQLTVDDDFSPPATWHDGCVGLLTIGRESRTWPSVGPGQARLGHRADRLRQAGRAGYARVPLRTPDASRPARLEAARNGLPESGSGGRAIGALGVETWQRIVGLTYGIVGVGRTGSVLAQSMAAGWGVERLVLIDPDRVEAHNLGEMACFAEQDIGRWKSEAVAAWLRSPLERPEITALNESITHLRSLQAVQACDVLFGGVDHDGARLAAAVLATLFCKPYLDVATGIHGGGDRRQMGADIRLTVPGAGRCLFCLGGLADPAGAAGAGLGRAGANLPPRPRLAAGADRQLA